MVSTVTESQPKTIPPFCTHKLTALILSLSRDTSSPMTPAPCFHHLYPGNAHRTNSPQSLLLPPNLCIDTYLTRVQKGSFRRKKYLISRPSPSPCARI